MSFGEKLKKHRKSIGLSQEELSKKLNISRQSISKWEQDKSLPDLVNSKILCQELNIKIEDILNDKESTFEVDDNKRNYVNSLNKKIVAVLFFLFISFLNYFPIYLVIYLPIIFIFILHCFSNERKKKTEVLIVNIISISIIFMCYFFFPKSLEFDIFQELILTLIVSLSLIFLKIHNFYLNRKKT